MVRYLENTQRPTVNRPLVQLHRIPTVSWISCLKVWQKNLSAVFQEMTNATKSIKMVSYLFFRKWFICQCVCSISDSGSECGSKSLPSEIPNNITRITGVAKPLPPGQIKCNILKGKLDNLLIYTKLISSTALLKLIYNVI